MALGARVTRHFFSRSERVKAVDVHPTEPLLLCGLYDGHLKICSFASLQQLADIDVSPLPIRAAAFVARRDWVGVRAGPSRGERPYLVSGADDATVRVWDYQTKQCVQVLRGHSKNVCSVTFGGCSPHALPVLFSGGEDGRLCIWNALTYKEEASLDLGLDRIWALALRPRGDGTDGGAAAGFGGMVIAVGSDAGTLVLKACESSRSSSSSSNSSSSSSSSSLWYIFPQSLSHHPNGRFLAVIGDGEYLIYTAQARGYLLHTTSRRPSLWKSFLGVSFLGCAATTLSLSMIGTATG
ncbi:hypothetical protein Emag_000674 [Eimeria magna]